MSTKKTITQKFLECQKIGLKQYGKYLSQQLVMANKSKNKEAYKKYIINQIALNNKRINKIETKLSK